MPIYSRGNYPGIQCRVGLVGPMARLDAVEKYISGPMVGSSPACREREGQTNNSNVVDCDFRISGQPEDIGVTCDT